MKFIIIFMCVISVCYSKDILGKLPKVQLPKMADLLGISPRVAAVKNFKMLTNSPMYDKDIRPNLAENTSVQVGITMYVINYDFNPETRDMSMMMYFRQMWNDPRLVSNSITEDVYGGQSLMERVWVPDTFFSNSMDVNIVKYPTRNTFLKVKPNGDVLYSERIKVNYRCGPQKSVKSDECTLEMESYGFSTVDVEYTWAKGDESINFDKKDTAQKYQLTEALPRNETVTLKYGTYSRLLATFKLNCRDCVDNDIIESSTATE